MQRELFIQVFRDDIYMSICILMVSAVFIAPTWMNRKTSMHSKDATQAVA